MAKYYFCFICLSKLQRISILLSVLLVLFKQSMPGEWCGCCSALEDWRDVALLPIMIWLPWHFESHQSMMFLICQVLLYLWNFWNKVLSTFITGELICSSAMTVAIEAPGTTATSTVFHHHLTCASIFSTMFLWRTTLLLTMVNCLFLFGQFSLKILEWLPSYWFLKRRSARTEDARVLPLFLTLKRLSLAILSPSLFISYYRWSRHTPRP